METLLLTTSALVGLAPEFAAGTHLPCSSDATETAIEPSLGVVDARSRAQAIVAKGESMSQSYVVAPSGDRKSVV